MQARITPLLFITLAALAGCESNQIRTLDRPDRDIYIDVSADIGTCTDQQARTRNKTCDFLLDEDPNGVACQEGAESSEASKDRFIIWESTQDFVLDFSNGHPFVNLMGRCNPANASQRTKRCKLKPRADLSEDFFKYDIEFTGTCRWDPHILIRR